MCKAILSMIFIVFALSSLGCGEPSLDTTCERHAEFTDYHGHTHVTHTCKDGMYLDGKLYN